METYGRKAAELYIRHEWFLGMLMCSCVQSILDKHCKSMGGLFIKYDMYIMF